MGPDNTLKKTNDNLMWEVHGSCECSVDGWSIQFVKVTLYVQAGTVHEACTQAMEKMGSKPVIRKVFQMGQIYEEA